MKRRTFVRTTGMAGAGLLLHKLSFAQSGEFPVVRVAPEKRRFRSEAVEAAIREFQSGVQNKELGWLFENCFPNTLDTTVTYREADGRPDTYVITGDIDAMWLRDSTAQVWPYLAFIKNDEPLKRLIAGVINRQTQCILKDPYANAFYDDEQRTGHWQSDLTNMKPGVHERKWEIDSLCYPIRLAFHYWKATGDQSIFDASYNKALKTILQVFREQQRKESDGPYKFQRNTPHATDTLPMSGYGYPVNPVGLICSAFRPSDDATVFLFLIPSNFFAVASLRQAATIARTVYLERPLASDLAALAAEVEQALKKYAITRHPVYGDVYAYEADGFGNHLLMDDANIPSLLALPYLGALPGADKIYRNTRRLILSPSNPFFFKGKAAEGIGGPHVGKDMIWPMSIIMRGITSTDDAEIAQCVSLLRQTHAGTGFMHEAFHKDNPQKFTRSWFAWANTLFGEFLWKVYKEKPHLLAK